MKNFSFKRMAASIAAVLACLSLCWGLSITSYVADADGITCTCNTGVMKVKICQADIVRVAYSPTSTIPTRPIKVVTNAWSTPATFTKTEAGDTIVLQTSRIKVKVSKTTANVTYTDLTDAVILSEAAKSMTPVTVSGTATNTVTTSYASPSTEGLYGLGQHMEAAGKAMTVNFKGAGQTLMDEMYGNPTFYTAVNVLLSTRGYGLFWDNYSKSWFYGNDASNTQFRFVSECGDVLDYYFFYGPQLDTVISKYRTTTGKAPMFPKWAYGFFQSKDHYGSQSEFLGVKDQYRNNHIPIDCIVQDWQYWTGSGGGAQGCYCFNTGFGDLKSTITQCHTANIHTMLSVWAEVEQGSDIYTTLNGKGEVWPTNNNCTTHFIDAYSTDARETFWNATKSKLWDPAVQGWDSWWLDNDEPFAYPCGFDRHSLTTAMGNGALFYNTFTFMFSQMGYDHWRRDIPNKRFLMLHRANFAGQQAHATVQWNSDIPCDFGTLANCVPCGLSATISGTPYWTTDIGGYWGSNGINWSNNNELFLRWFEYGAFCPIFRIHGNGPGKELYQNQWSTTTKASLLMIDKLHYRLMPYIYTLAWMTTNNDYTPMRHLIMDFTSDANVKNIGTQYMYGPEIMVSPVTTQGQTSRSVYLPAGKWYDFWTGAAVNGGASVTTDAPVSQIPLHVRAGSIVPMGPEIEYATQRADTIELRVYPGANGSFTMYEDEGDNYNYETGKYATIPITYIDNTQNVVIGARSGSFPGMDAKKVFNIVFVASNHGTGEGVTATHDKQLIYTGDAVATGVVGVLPGQSAAPEMLPADFTGRVAGKMVMLPNAFFGKTKNISVYDCAGKQLQRAVVKKNALDLRKDFGLPGGIYIVKAAAVR